MVNRIGLLKGVLVLLIIVLQPVFAYSRLGETSEENEARYGKPIDNFIDKTRPVLARADNRTYRYQGWQIRIGYLNDHAVRLLYSKIPAKGDSPVLKDDEISAVLKAEEHDGEWKRLKAASLFSLKNSGNKSFDHASLRWENSNGCIAYSLPGRISFYVEAPEAAMWEQVLANEKEIQRKENIPKF